MAGKLIVRFHSEDDLKLLREVEATNPFRDRALWPEVAANVNLAVNRESFIITARRARERTQLLVEKFKAETRISAKSSGIEEQYSEKDVLLQEIVELMEEENRKREAGKKMRVNQEEAAKLIRKKALETLTPEKENKTETTENKPSTSKKGSVLGYLEKKVQSEQEMKGRELQLKEQQLKLEMNRFELEKQERMERIERERQDRLMFMEMMKKFMNTQ